MNNAINDLNTFIDQIFNDATKKLWEQYPDIKEHQMILINGLESFDDWIMKGLDYDFID